MARSLKTDESYYGGMGGHVRASVFGGSEPLLIARVAALFMSHAV